MTTPEQCPASTTPLVSPLIVPQPRKLAFTCTFCWHTYSTPPRVVGRTARLACDACYIALVNLSICWVCGEVVVRGDDCVSLGWCFWHKSCYGCLICGSRMVVHGLTVKAVFSEGDDMDDVKEKDGLMVPEGQAKEIDEIPLCAHCYVDVGNGEMDSRTAVNGALRRMDCSDGGLSRLRYEYGRQVRADAPKPNLPSAHHSVETYPLPLGSTIHVSIRDPTAPAFRPSPTKPIPNSMTGSPGRAGEANDHGLRTEPAPNNNFSHPSPAELSLLRRLSIYSAPTDHASKPYIHTSEPVQPPAARTTMSRPTNTPILSPEPISAASPKLLRMSRVGFINSESLKRPSSRLNRIREESSHAESRTPSPYLTPPEWPESMYASQTAAKGTYEDVAAQEAASSDPPGRTYVFSETSSQRLSSVISPTQTPIQGLLPRLSIASEPSNLPQHPRLPRKSTMLKAKIAAHQPPSRPSAIPMSAEFLERYGLVKGREHPQPSALLKKAPPSSRRSSNEPQAIMARLTRNSRSAATTGRVDETTVVTETDGSETPNLFSLNSAAGLIAPHDGPALDTEQVGRWRWLRAELRILLRP